MFSVVKIRVLVSASYEELLLYIFNRYFSTMCRIIKYKLERSFEIILSSLIFHVAIGESES